MADNTDYILPWMNRFPDCKVDSEQEMSFGNFDWESYSNKLNSLVEQIFFGLVQPIVGPGMVWQNRSGYSKGGLKAEHCKAFIKSFTGSDYLRGKNMVKRLSSIDTNLQPHIKNESNRRQVIEKHLQRVYGVDEMLMKVGKRSIRFSDPPTDIQLKRYKNLPRNYMSESRRRHRHSGNTHGRGKTEADMQKYIHEKLDTSIHFINTTQDTAKMVSDFITKITTIVDYDRIFLFPCINQVPKQAISNMQKQEKKFWKKSGQVAQGYSINSKGSVCIIPAGYSLPPMDIEDYYKLGFDTKADSMAWVRDARRKEKNHRGGYGYYGNKTIHSKIVKMSGIFIKLSHTRQGNANKFTVHSTPYYGYSNHFAQAGLHNILDEVWNLFKGHSIYPEQLDAETDYQQQIQYWKNYPVINTSKVPFFWNLTRKEGILKFLGNLTRGQENSERRMLWKTHTEDLLKHFKQKGISNIKVGSKEFASLLKPAIPETYRDSIKSTMYDNHYVEIRARGAFHTLNYIVNGIPIFEDKS